MHEWTETKRLLVLNGNGSQVVFKSPTPRGYQFVYRKKSSFCATLEGAKEMLEAIAELGHWPE
jgi:hypothetical protein